MDVGPYKETRIRAFGPGLVSGVVNKPAVFVVETNGETGALGGFLFLMLTSPTVPMTILLNSALSF